MSQHNENFSSVLKRVEKFGRLNNVEINQADFEDIIRSIYQKEPY